MSVCALMHLAKADIFDIWCYIADDSEDAADRVEQAIYDACVLVAQAPMRGHSRPDLTTRSLPAARPSTPRSKRPRRNFPWWINGSDASFPRFAEGTGSNRIATRVSVTPP